MLAAAAVPAIAGLFGHKKNKPAAVGKAGLNNVTPAMSPYYQPYIDKGRAAGDSVNEQYGQQVNDPGGVYNKLGAGYKESPGYQYRLNQAMNAGNQANAAGGMLGTPQNQEQNMQTAGDMAGADFEKYMQNVMGIYQGGIKGQEGTATRGYDASGRMGDAAGGVEAGKASMDYNQADSDAQDRKKRWENLASGIGAAGTAYNSYNQTNNQGQSNNNQTQQQKFMEMMQKFFSNGGA